MESMSHAQLVKKLYNAFETEQLGCIVIRDNQSGTTYVCPSCLEKHQVETPIDPREVLDITRAHIDLIQHMPWCELNATYQYVLASCE